MNLLTCHLTNMSNIFKKCRGPQLKHLIENVSPNYALNFKIALSKIVVLSILLIIWKTVAFELINN